MARRTLTKEQIVAAATQLLDEEGIGGLSMRRLGSVLGSGATTIYWHVPNREELIQLAADRVWAEVPLPDPAENGWRAAASAIAEGTYAMLTRHLWLVPAFGNQVLYGEGLAAYEDHCYAVYENAGFKGSELDWAFNTVFTFVLGTALGDAAAQVARVGRSEPAASAAEEHAAGVALRFPRVKARREALRNADSAHLQRESLTFGVGTILDWLEARLELDAGNRD